ncbi:MAG TPA: hypothetical protein VLU95_05855 [Candidatus Acidoferrum sp.]|nr:hypothetical protein [Candidatus Acidoferrum sp.]
MKKNTKIVKFLLISVIFLLTLDYGSTYLQSPNVLNASLRSSVFPQVFASAAIPPNVALENLQTGGTNVTIVTGTFKNNQYQDVYGIATATVTTNDTFTEKLSSNITLVPAQGTTTITITFNDLPFQPYYSCLMSFAAEYTLSPTESGTQTANPIAPTPVSGGSTGGGNYSSVVIAIISIAVIALVSVTGFMMFKKTRFSEQKVRRFTSSEYQNWILKRLGGHASSALDSRKGIDGYTGANDPMMIKQSDNIGKLQVQNFMNAIIQTRARNGLIVAFGFDAEAQAAASRARMNRIEIKLVTVKELIERKETVLL